MKKIYDGFDLLMKALCALFGMLLGIMILVISLDVLLRNIGRGSLPWGVEVTEYVLYGGSFLAAPWLLRQGRHVRVDVLPMVLSDAWKKHLDTVVSTMGACVCAIMAYYGFAVVLDAYAMNTLQFKNLVVPEWILFLPLAIGCAMLTIEFLLRLFGVHKDPGDGELAELLSTGEQK